MLFASYRLLENAVLAFCFTFVRVLMLNHFRFLLSSLVVGLTIVIGSKNVYAQAPAFDFVTAGLSVGQSYVGATAYRTAVDALGYTYTTGWFEGTLTMGAFTLASANPRGSNVFVAKFDPQGSCVWAVRAGGADGRSEALGIALDASRNIYIAGSFNGSTATFGNTSLTNTVASELDVFVAKLDGQGNFVWATRGGGSGADYSTDIAVDANGDVFVTGVMDGTAAFGNQQLVSAGYFDVFVAKMTATGQWLWAERGGGSSVDYSNALAIDSNGNAVVTGYFLSPIVTFGATQLNNQSTTNSSRDIFVARINGAGNWQWAVGAGGAGSSGNGNGIPGDDWAYDVVTDRYDNAYITGSFYSNQARFGTTILTNRAQSTPTAYSATGDVFVAKLSPTGQFLWASGAGGASHENGRAVAVGPDGSVYCAGSYSSYQATVAFGNVVLLPAAGQSEVYVAALDSTGSWRWALSAGGMDTELATGMTTDASGKITLSGEFNSLAATFGSITVNGSPSLRFPVSGERTPFVARMTSGNPPVLRALSPNAVSIGSAALTLAVTGTGFTSSSVVRFNGQALATGYVSPTQLTATLPATALMVAGRYPVVVATPFARGGSVSTTLQFEVQTTVTAAQVADEGAILAVYPNPSHESFNVSLRYPSKTMDKVQVEIFNALGKKVVGRPLTVQANKEQSTVFQGLQAGLYTVRVTVGTTSLFRRVVVY